MHLENTLVVHLAETGFGKHFWRISEIGKCVNSRNTHPIRESSLNNYVIVRVGVFSKNSREKMSQKCQRFFAKKIYDIWQHFFISAPSTNLQNSEHTMTNQFKSNSTSVSRIK